MKQGLEFIWPEQQTRTIAGDSAGSNANTVDLTKFASTLYRTAAGLRPVTSFFLGKMYRRVDPNVLTNSERISATELQGAWVGRDTRKLHAIACDMSTPGWARRAAVAEECLDSVGETYAGPVVGRVAMAGEAVHLAAASGSTSSSTRGIALPWPSKDI